MTTVLPYLGPLQTALSYLSPGSWTSSGGSFKLAEDAGYDLTNIIVAKADETGEAGFVEIGAGYAGFRSNQVKGIKKLVECAGDRMGRTITADFTNLTEWHDGLPNGVREHPGYAARDIAELADAGVKLVDIIYSQVAADFEPRIGEFVRGSAELLKPSGLLIFNSAPEQQKSFPAGNERERLITETAASVGLQLERLVVLGGANGNLYVFKK